MVYILDTNSIRVIGNYYPDRFPSFWERFDISVEQEKIVSVREVYRELDYQITKPYLREWIDGNKGMFLIPTQEETNFVGQIFAIPHFQTLIRKKNQLTGRPVADPFVIACAYAKKACVVSEEKLKENAASIPNICIHFGIECTNIEGMMEREDWEF